mgnify:CR=1 FL=1
MQLTWTRTRLPTPWMSSPQPAHTPYVWAASLKQMPQIAPSGQRTRILALMRPHRSQCFSPSDRGRPRGSGGVSEFNVAGRTRPYSRGLAIVSGDAGADGPVVAQVGNAWIAVRDALLADGAGVCRGEGH